MDAVEALIDAESYARNEQLVKAFLSNRQDLAKMDEYLTERQQRETEEGGTNWVYKWWLDDMYLTNMLPLPVNSNPGWVLPRRDFAGSRVEMLKYVAQVVKGVADFKRRLER